jgi:hypothetical protein
LNSFLLPKNADPKGAMTLLRFLPAMINKG